MAAHGVHSAVQGRALSGLDGRHAVVAHAAVRHHHVVRMARDQHGVRVDRGPHVGVARIRVSAVHVHALKTCSKKKNTRFSLVWFLRVWHLKTSTASVFVQTRGGKPQSHLKRKATSRKKSFFPERWYSGCLIFQSRKCSIPPQNNARGIGSDLAIVLVASYIVPGLTTTQIMSRLSY